MIGERLAEIRKDHDMSQQELADRLSLTKYAVSSYEREKTVPSDEIKVRIAKIFNISLDYLLGLINEPLSYNRKKKCLILPDDLTSKDEFAIRAFVDFVAKYHTKN